MVATFESRDGGGGGPQVSAETFVKQRYLDFLGHPPAPGEMTHWLDRIKSHASARVQLIDAMLQSQEFAGRHEPLVRLYSAYFQRLPDYQGLKYWVGNFDPRAQSGNGSLGEVSNAFAGSAEFRSTYGPLDDRAFVERVYRNVLGRLPDAQGLQFWEANLAAGTPRGSVMIGFSESQENRAVTAPSVLVTLACTAMLQRSPSAAEQSRWVGEFQSGRTSRSAFIGAPMKSAEYAARF